MESALKQTRDNENIVYLKDDMAVVHANSAVLVVIVLDKSRDLGNSLFRDNEMVVFLALGELAPYREAEAVDSHEVEFSPFDIEQLARENGLAFIQRRRIACHIYHRAERHSLYREAPLIIYNGEVGVLVRSYSREAALRSQ